MKYLKSFILSIAAGVCIGIGGILNVICLSLGQKILGGILFSVGLFTICLFGFKLFTGQVGYLFAKEKKGEFLLHLGIFYIGNFIGAFGLGYLMRITAIATPEMMTVAEELAIHKLAYFPIGTASEGQPFYSVFILSIFCGLLVFFAVDIFRREKIHPVVRMLGLMFFVGGFVICGFEHCIADMFYLAFGNAMGLGYVGETLLSILFGSSGNVVGAFAGYFIVKLAESIS